MKSAQNKPRGSILIWTVLLSIALTSAFFFFSQRLNFNAALQIKAIEEQNAEAFLESYANYLESLSFEELKTLAGDIEYQGITGTLSNGSKQVKSAIDVGEMITYQVANGKARVEWNLCANNEAGRTLEITSVEKVKASQCAGGYDQSAETMSSTSFTMTAGTAPVSYRITALEDAIVYDRAWKMDLSLTAENDRIISIQRTFIPEEDIDPVPLKEPLPLNNP